MCTECQTRSSETGSGATHRSVVGYLTSDGPVAAGGPSTLVSVHADSRSSSGSLSTIRPETVPGDHGKSSSTAARPFPSWPVPLALCCLVWASAAAVLMTPTGVNVMATGFDVVAERALALGANDQLHGVAEVWLNPSTVFLFCVGLGIAGWALARLGRLILESKS